MFQRDELKSLIQAGKADEAKLEALQRKFREKEPEWTRLQEAAEDLASAIGERDRTFSNQVADLWHEREVALRRELAKTIAARDELTTELLGEINAVKQRIFLRNATAYGNFGSWCAAAVAQLPPDSPLASELIEARRRCEASSSIEEIISIATSAARKAEAVPKLGVFNPAALAAA
jgi:hypothetical protein